MTHQKKKSKFEKLADVRGIDVQAEAAKAKGQASRGERVGGVTPETRAKRKSLGLSRLSGNTSSKRGSGDKAARIKRESAIQPDPVRFADNQRRNIEFEEIDKIRAGISELPQAEKESILANIRGRLDRIKKESEGAVSGTIPFIGGLKGNILKTGSNALKPTAAKGTIATFRVGLKEFKVNVGGRLIANTKTIKQTNQILQKIFSLKTLTVLGGSLAAWAGSVYFGLWGQAEAPEPISIAINKHLIDNAMASGNWTLVDESIEAMEEITNLSKLKQLGLFSPLSPLVGTTSKIKG